MITITERPLRTIGALTSRWTAGHNPVVYKFERSDYDVTDVQPTPALHGGSILVRIPAIGIGLHVGGSAYLGTVKYKGIGTIADVQESGGTTTYVWLTGIAANGLDMGGKFNDLGRRNYRIEIQIKEAGSDKLLGVADVAPFTNGLGKIDLRRYLSAYLLLRNDFAYNTVNKRDVYGSVKFYITYQERWLGNDGPVISDSAQPIFVTNSAKQIMDKHGQNMAEYVISNVSPAKFLTKFKSPVYWEGYPFSLSFIYSELLSFQVHKVEALLDVNKVQTGVNSAQLSDPERESVNRLMLDGGYGAATKYVRLKLRTGNPIPDDYVYPGYVDEGYVAQT